MRTILFLFAVLFSVAGFGQQQMLLRGAAAGGDVGILDGYTADAAYCTCWLYSSYSGSLLRVRRDSDNAEQDIGRDGQGLDEAALISFCSGTNCFVVNWYDQSGNNYTAMQASAALQAKIYDSSTGLITQSGLPAISGDGINDVYTAGDILSGLSAFSSFVVVDINETGPNVDFFNKGVGVLGEREYAFLLSPGMLAIKESTSAGATSSDVLSDIYSLFYGGYNATSIFSGENGGALSSQTKSFALENRSSALTLMGASVTARASQGNYQAFIFYDSDQTANRVAIETALNNYFSIY